MLPLSSGQQIYGLKGLLWDLRLTLHQLSPYTVVYILFTPDLVLSRSRQPTQTVTPALRPLNRHARSTSAVHVTPAV